MWPDLIETRRLILPALEKYDGKLFIPEAKYSFKLHDKEFAGVWEDVSVREAREIFRDMEDVYPRNLAGCKYRENGDGERVYEYGSYTYVPGGFFGKWQYHFRFVPHDDGLAIFGHEEINPWHSPGRHYRAEEWDAENGREKARELLPLDEDSSLDGIRGYGNREPFRAMKETFNKVTDDLVTIAAIAGVGYLALKGVTDPWILSVVAALGGYRMRQRSTERRPPGDA